MQIAAGSLKAIPKDKLKKADLSVCRGEYGKGVDAKKHIVDPQIARDPTKIDRGYVWAIANEIRQIPLGTLDHGAICVVDDGLKSFRAHAVLGYADPPHGLNESVLASHRLAARGDLLKLFERRLPEDWTTWSFN